MIPKKILKIGIDLDDTLWDFQSVFLNFYNEKFKTKHNSKDFSFYSLEKFLNLSKEEVTLLLNEFEKHSSFMNLPLVNGSKKAIEKLKENHKLFFITARPPKRKSSTKEFFSTHFGNAGKLYFLGDSSFPQLKNKGEVCKYLGIDLMIDDSLENLKSCLSLGIPSFLIDRPWNNFEEIEGIKRVKNWEEILNLINKNEN